MIFDGGLFKNTLYRFSYSGPKIEYFGDFRRTRGNGPGNPNGLARESFNLKSCSLDSISAILARLGGRLAAI